MRITVAICTWNRAKLLDQTLNEMHRLEVPPDVDWELLIVNNNCTDETDEVIARHRPHLPIQRLFESTPGQSSARNCAIAAATGDLILWTDDDVLVDPGWIAAYWVAAERYPDASFFGGRILPWFEGTPPRWLRDHWRAIGGAFALRDFGDAPIQFNRSLVPFGANLAIRSAAQRRYLFDVRLGLRPGSRLAGEETTLIRQMMDDGLMGWWVPKAKVLHFLPKSRQTTRYLWEFSFGYGQVVALRSPPVGGAHWLGKPRWMWRQLAEAAIRYYLGRPWSSPPVWLRGLMKYAERCGQLYEYQQPPSSKYRTSSGSGSDGAPA
jgi:glucosyl-dolichyl phosphate glucuronosyltransferase